MLKPYTKDVVPVLGIISVPVVYNDKTHHLNLIVVKGNCHVLLGRDCLQSIKVDWKNSFELDCMLPTSKTYSIESSPLC